MCQRCANQTAFVGRGFGMRALFAGLAMLSLVMSGCGMMPTFGSKSEETSAGVPAKSSKRGKGAAEEVTGAAAEPVLPPEAVQQFDKAVAAMSAGDFTAAEQGFRALAAAYPTYSGPLLNLGILHAKAGKLEE